MKTVESPRRGTDAAKAPPSWWVELHRVRDAAGPSSGPTWNRSALALELYDEYWRRRNAGEDVDPDDYLAQHPSVRSTLERWLRADSVFAKHPECVPGLPPPEWPELGEEFAGCRLLDFLGRGNFARVYLGAQTQLGDRPVAVKVSRYGHREAWTLGRLHHPNVVPVFSFFEDEEACLTAVCMPYLGSATLHDVLDGCGPRPPRDARPLLDAVADAVCPPGAREVPPPTALLLKGRYVDAVAAIGAQLADALAFIHARQVLHLDLKPSNVLMTPDGRPMLLDFNLAEDGELETTRLGGTLPYMSPEQLDASDRRLFGPTRPVDARSDLFALGVLLYQLFTGRHPFGPLPVKLDNHAAFDLLRTRHQTGFEPLRQHAPDVSPDLAAAVERCLRVDLEERPQDAAELARRLWACVPAEPRPRPRRTFLGMAVGVAVLAAVAAGVLWQSTPQATKFDPPDQRQLGEAAFADKHYAQAIHHFTNVLQGLPDNDPERAKLLMVCGIAYVRLGEQGEPRFDQAYASFFEAHKLQSGGLAKECLAYCLLRQPSSLVASAKDWLEQAVATQHQTPEALNNLGYCCEQLHELGQAEQYLDRAIALNDKLPAAYHNRALVHLKRAYEVGGSGRLVRHRRLDSIFFARIRAAQKDMGCAVKLAPSQQAEVLRDAAIVWAKAAERDPADVAQGLHYLMAAVEAGYDAAGEQHQALASLYHRRLGDEPRMRVLIYQHGPGRPMPPTTRVMSPP
jgi:serine/threonine protein kinase/Flp pilus assembly protein TadD